MRLLRRRLYKGILKSIDTLPTVGLRYPSHDVTGSGNYWKPEAVKKNSMVLFFKTYFIIY